MTTLLIAALFCTVFSTKMFLAREKINSIFKCLTGFKTPAYSILQMKLRRSITEA